MGIGITLHSRDRLDRVETVLCDFDQTLVQLYPDRRDLIGFQNHIVSELNQRFHGGILEFPLPQLDEDPYKYWFRAIQSVRLTMPEEVANFLDDMFYQRERKQVQHATSMPGASQFLRRVANGRLPFALVTSNYEEWVRRCVERLFPEVRIDVVVGRPLPIDVNLMKPNAAPALSALDQLGIQPTERVMMLGDSTSDIAAGNAAGCTSVGVTTGDVSGTELLDAGAAYVFRSLFELLGDDFRNQSGFVTCQRDGC